jgi:hypothetical protein
MKRKYFGMTMGQLIVLVVLGLMACSLVGVSGVMLFTMTANVQPPAPQTFTPAPSQTPLATTTTWPTITPIPDWKEFRFASDKASIWLPTSYSGGDTVTSSETILQNIRGATDDEAFINDIQELIVLPEVKFFAFDSNLDNGSKFMYVGNEELDPDLVLTMDDYLNSMMDDFTGGSERIVERQIIQLDRYPAGKLVIENKVPAGDVETFISMAIYTVRADNTMWFITFRSGREDFKDYQPVIETSVNSFWAQP